MTHLCQTDPDGTSTDMFALIQEFRALSRGMILRHSEWEGTYNEGHCEIWGRHCVKHISEKKIYIDVYVFK